MSIDIYTPTTLLTELDKFKKAEGNYNIDYRSNTVKGDLYCIDTPYSQNTPFQQVLQYFPLTKGETHVSGNIKNYFSIPIDYVFKNNLETTSVLNILTTFDTLYEATYDKTVFALYGDQGKLLHYFKTKEIIGDVTLYPLSTYLDSTETVGTKVIGRLKYNTYNTVESVTYSKGIITVVEGTSKKLNNGQLIEKKDLSDIVEVSCFYSKGESALKTKLKYVTQIKETTTSLLNPLLTNYTLYSDVNDVKDSVGYTIQLNPKESVLLSQEVYSTDIMIKPNTVLCQNKLLYNDFYTGYVPSYSGVIKIELPEEVPSIPIFSNNDDESEPIGYEDAKYVVFINDKKYEYKSITKTAELYEKIRKDFLLEGIYLHLLQNDTMVFINSSKEDKTVSMFYYEYDCINNENIKILTALGTTVDTSTEYLPKNSTLTFDREIALYKSLYKDFYDYECHIFKLKADSTFVDSIKNTIKFTLDKTVLKTLNQTVISINGNDITIPLNLTSEDTVEKDFCDTVNKKVSNLTFTTDSGTNSMCTITSDKVVTVSLDSSIFKVDSNYIGLISKLKDTLIFELSI